MPHGDKILLGIGQDGPAYILSNMVNRHGLIAGASGTGKSVCMKVLAEALAENGIPVLLTDIKGDIGGMFVQGSPSVENNQRLYKCGIDPQCYSYQMYPTLFWDLYGAEGHHVRATVEKIDPLLMARVLELNEIQTDVLETVYRICRDENLILDDLNDLSAVLLKIGCNAEDYTFYGRMAKETIGVIQRQVYQLKERGGDAFFGRPEINVLDWFRTLDPQFGMINILSARRLVLNYHIYSAFLIWLLTEICNVLPDRSEIEQPVFVVLLDAADSLFKWCSKRLISKIEQLIRMMRSKGVGIFMSTSNPLDIPESINRQLHNRIMFSMNAYTPYEQRNVDLIAKGLPNNPRINVVNELALMEKGDAFVSLMGNEGIQCMTRKITVLPPKSYLGRISRELLVMAIKNSPYDGRYDNAIDYYSAYEQLSASKSPSIWDI